MEKLKFTLFSIVILTVLGLVVYWSFNTIQSGTEHKANEEITQLQKENEELAEEAKSLKDEIGLLQAQVNSTKEAEKPAEETSGTGVENPNPTTYKNQTLINELQKLIDDKIYLKLKSNGTRVGTVQKFLNIYNKTSNKVDNDYGASTKTAVTAFQNAQGLTADGEAGPGTFTKMIDWLKKQG